MRHKCSIQTVKIKESSFFSPNLMVAFIIVYRLNLNMSALRWKNGSLQRPTSICSEPCLFGQSKINTSECCWMCVSCKVCPACLVICLLVCVSPARYVQRVWLSVCWSVYLLQGMSSLSGYLSIGLRVSCKVCPACLVICLSPARYVQPVWLPVCWSACLLQGMSSVSGYLSVGLRVSCKVCPACLVICLLVCVSPARYVQRVWLSVCWSACLLQGMSSLSGYLSVGLRVSCKVCPACLVTCLLVCVSPARYVQRVWLSVCWSACLLQGMSSVSGYLSVGLRVSCKVCPACLVTCLLVCVSPARYVQRVWLSVYWSVCFLQGMSNVSGYLSVGLRVSCKVCPACLVTCLLVCVSPVKLRVCCAVGL